LVVECKLSKKELEEWTLDEIYKANSLLEMKQDYKIAKASYEKKKLDDLVKKSGKK
jgi:hypothetical protein